MFLIKEEIFMNNNPFQYNNASHTIPQFPTSTTSTPWGTSTTAPKANYTTSSWSPTPCYSAQAKAFAVGCAAGGAGGLVTTGNPIPGCISGGVANAVKETITNPKCGLKQK